MGGNQTYCSMTNIRKLPRCVYKGELTTYFSCTPDYLWRNILKEELLSSWGYNIDEIKSFRQLPYRLTLRIYVHFEITDLTEDFVTRVQAMIAEKEQRLPMTG